MLLLIANRKLALRLLVCVGKLLKVLHGWLVADCDGELDVALGVLVAGVYFRVVRQACEDAVQRAVHFLGTAFEEAPAAADEEGVACEDDALVCCLVVEEEADGVLRVAWCVQCRDFNVFAERQLLVVAWGRGDVGAVLAADDGQRVLLCDLCVAACMVVVVVRVDDGFEVNGARRDEAVEDGQDFGRIGGVDDGRGFGRRVGYYVCVVVARPLPHWY